MYPQNTNLKRTKESFKNKKESKNMKVYMKDNIIKRCIWVV